MGVKASGDETSDKQREFAQFLSTVAQAEIAANRVPFKRRLYELAATKGFLVPTFADGLDSPPARRQRIALLRELGRARLPGFAYWVHSEIFCGLLGSYGPDLVRKRYLPGVAKGTVLGCVALTEPTGGSTLTELATHVDKTSDGYVLNGSKRFVSLGGLADLAIVSARNSRSSQTGLYLVALKKEGIRIRSIKNRLSMLELDLAELEFVDHVVPPDHLIASDLTVPLLRFLSLERFICSVVGMGVLEETLRRIVHHANMRSVGKQRLTEFQVIRLRIAHLTSRTAAVRSFIDGQCERFVHGRRISPSDASMCKVIVMELLKETASYAVELEGAAGVTGSAEALKVLNDAFAQSIYGGTGEVLLEIVAADRRR